MALIRHTFRFVERVPLGLSPDLDRFLRDLIFAVAEDLTIDKRLVRKGESTFATSGTKTVTFDEDLGTTDYSIALGPQADENFWVTTKLSSGFTLNSSNASSTAVVEWIIRITDES